MEKEKKLRVNAFLKKLDVQTGRFLPSLLKPGIMVTERQAEMIARHVNRIHQGLRTGDDLFPPLLSIATWINSLK